ncbi:MAG: tRNA uracil 4-sulfurtransferase ThiI [Halanaerobiales bacterium]
MYDVILIRFGEIALKGKNRPYFLNKLKNNIKDICGKLGNHKVRKTHGRLFIYPKGDTEKLIKRLKMIPGIVSLSPGISLPLSFEKLKEKSLSFFQQEVKDYPTTFKVETKRANKDFPKNSMEINKEIGAHLLQNISGENNILSVDVHQPEHKLQIEVRKNHIYLFTRVIRGPGGLPVQSSGKGLLLLSGGIDSPVAGWQAMKRGVKLEALYFHSFPFTGDRAKEKVIDLARILSKYGGEIKLHIGYFTDIQKAIKEKVPTRFNVTIMRRMMYRMAEKIARKRNLQVLITGESIGQVASQTLENLTVINRVVDMPVIRPLVGYDKQEIIKEARKIKTYDISIQPYEDCCTVFVPDHPVTRPDTKETRNAEKNLEIKSLISSALTKSETVNIKE